MNEDINQIVLDKLTKVCVCKVVTRAKIKEAISNGASTIDEVADVTGATKGCCKGARCKHTILTLIKDNK
ncbi:MAG: (2Fe-2S)-binding protein [Clostridium sp.]